MNDYIPTKSFKHWPENKDLLSTTSHKILDNLDEMENSLNVWEYSPDIINNKQSEKLYAYKDRE